ncbi:MAG TPA: hypothetical protein VFG01_03930 [Acidobacteriota bacterium]|nr:hypothetical protein [Acidobacteriota bacterium]
MRKVLLIVCLSLLLPLSFCSSNKKEVVYISPQKEDVKQRESIPLNLPPGDFQEAIEAYSTAHQKNPDNKIILEDYIQTLEEVKLSADKAFDEGNYLLANNRYYIFSKNFSRFESFQKSLSFDLETIRMRMRECLVKRTEIQVTEALQHSDYSIAIEAYRNALRAYPNDAYLTSQLTQTVTVINKESEKALGRKDYAVAGKVSFLLLKNFAWLQDSISSLSFSKSSLENNIQNCTSQLTKKGIKLYREGELKKAIAVWKDILEFDPENVQIKKAIANAQEQLARIKK